jgi:hypothetical protein
MAGIAMLDAPYAEADRSGFQPSPEATGFSGWRFLPAVLRK